MTPLFLASLSLTLLALLAAALLKRLRIQSPGIHRLTWMIVLFQGLVLVGIPFQLPILESRDALPATSSALTTPALENGNSETQPLPTEIAPVLTPPETHREKLSLSAIIYFTGCLLGLIYFVAAYLALLWGVRKAKPAPGEWQEQLNRLLRDRNREHINLSLLVHRRMGPLLCRLPSGYTIVLPQHEWSNLSAEQREAVLEHEFAHIERRDIWKSLAMRLLALIHWFNPVAWWAARQFEEAAEWDCDRRLTRKGKRYTINYAKALLAFAEPKTLRPVGASLARGAALSPRIDRLTSLSSNRRESIVRRLLFIIALMILAGFSLLRFELVARDDEHEPEDTEFADRLGEYSTRIEGSGSVLEDFRKAISTKPGQIVIRDLSEGAGEEARERKIASAFSDHINRYFQTVTGNLRLKPEVLDFKEKMLRTHAVYEKDISSIQSAMGDVRKSLSKKSEAGKLIARFLEQPDAAHWIYIKEIRKAMHPGEEMIREHLGSVLVPGKFGGLMIAPSRRGRVESMIHKGQRVREIAVALDREFPAFTKEIATPDETHKVYKKLMSEPNFAYYIATRIAGDDELKGHSAVTAVHRIFDHIEGGFIDKADGLHINPEEQDEMKELFDHYQLVSASIPSISEPLTNYASRIEPSDKLHETTREILMSPVALMLFGMELEGAGIDADAGYYFKKLIGEFLESDSGGTFSVRKSGQDEVTEAMRNAFRDLRNVGRKRRQLIAEVAGLEDIELKNIYQSPVGSLIVLQMIREEIESSQPDGLAIWFAAHFDEDEGGSLLPKAQSMELLSEIVEKANAISGNLKELDF